MTSLLPDYENKKMVSELQNLKPAKLDSLDPAIPQHCPNSPPSAHREAADPAWPRCPTQAVMTHCALHLSTQHAHTASTMKPVR